MDSNSRGNIDAKRRRPEPEDLESIQQPLIPSSIIDQASQRLFIVSFFVLIQCWKIYDIILLKSDVMSSSVIGLAPLNTFTFIAKYAMVDGLFLWLLPILNIPYLVYSPLKTFLLTLLLNGVTFFLASDMVFPLISNMMLPVWKIIFSRKELTLFGDSVNSNNIVDPNEHFKGRYTIQFLPDSSARFNPFHFDNICLESNSYSSVQMPIEFNTTTQLGFLQLQHITPSNERKLINYTEHDLHKLLKKDYSHLRQYQENVRNDDRIFYAEVPIKSPGLYRINKVSDKKGISIRTYRSDFVISHCPSAEFVHSISPKSYQNYKCIGSDISNGDFDINLPLVSSFGVGPVVLKFETRLNGRNYKSFNVTVSDTSLHETQSSNNKNFNNLSWLQSHRVTRNILEQELFRNVDIIPKSGAGKLEFQLLEVSDILENKKVYNPSSKDKDVWYSIELKQAPKVEIADPDPQEVLLVNGTKSLSFNYQNLKEQDFPLEIDIKYIHPSDPLLSTNYTNTYDNSQQLSRGIQCDKPGTYSVIKGRSKYCPCDIMTSKVVSVERATPPSVEIVAEPVVDKCVGMTGYKFDFEFLGKPPFFIQYHVYQNRSDGTLRPVYNERGRSNRLLKTFDKDYKFEYRPPKEGNYVIMFDSLKDFNYHKEPILLDEKKHTYSTYFNQRSKASFFETKGEILKTFSACMGESVTVPLSLKGNAPFSFNYDILNIDTGEKLIETSKLLNVSDSTFNIVTPSLKSGGNFEIVLSEAKDGSSCPIDFDKRESIKIKARSDVPEISIDTDSSYKSVKIIEGDSYKIPLSLKSSIGSASSDVLEYIVSDLHNASNSQMRTLRNSKSLLVKEEGTYLLSSFTNGGCVGKIGTQKAVSVSYYNRPNLTLITEDQQVLKQHSEENDLFVHLKPLCQNCGNKIRLNLEGVKPFVIDYDITLPTGKVESRSMTVNDHNITINLPTKYSGKYEHRFKGIYDKLYTREKVSRIPKKNEVLPCVRYDINPSPKANFRKDQFLQICETSLRRDEPLPKIPISFVGEYPFRIDASLRHEATGMSETFTFENIMEPELKLNEAKINGKDSLLFETMNVGEHTLTINELTDANGCTEKEFSQLNNYVISITEVPNISKMQKRPHYCVGDHILYNMSGIPPFMVYYRFNDKLQKAESGHRFQRLASKAGELSIEALSDSSANQCLVNLTNSQEKFEELKLKVYELPSVEINQGSYVVQDIHEGEQTEIKFSFSGVPPFKLIYTRTSEQVDPKHKHKKTGRKDKHSKIVVETKTVEDIWDYEYTDMVSLEGTYEAIEVRDAYCVAKRDVNYT